MWSIPQRPLESGEDLRRSILWDCRGIYVLQDLGNICVDKQEANVATQFARSIVHGSRIPPHLAVCCVARELSSARAIFSRLEPVYMQIKLPVSLTSPM